jgi:hypothetical protein
MSEQSIALKWCGSEMAAEIFPRLVVDQVLSTSGRAGKRERKLPAYLMVYYVITCGLMVSESAREVLRRLIGSACQTVSDLERVATRSAICKALERLGVEPVRKLYAQVVRPIATKVTKGAWFKGLRLVALDGTCLNLPDSESNRKAFGKPGAAGGKTAPFPQIQIVALCELGTRVFFAVRMAGWRVGEATLAHDVIKHLRKGMLCLADRGFYGYPLWEQAVKTKAHLLWRVQKKIPLPRLKMLPDGSYISEVRPRSNAPAAERKKRLKVRVVEFFATVGGKTTHYRLVTTLLDPTFASATELADLYAKRWGIETAFGELKSDLREAKTLIRTRRSDLVEQDLFGLFLAHFAIRKLMAESAEANDLEPCELSFVHAVRIILRRLPEMVSFSPLTLQIQIA